ncbi:hypothetical protein Dda_2204 [Drechslerella dactyloides]|uniref:Uncharacterized protein n=1 Tax=Drechslerella dactyloides TaxID=74499 RepID=A0AAD6NL95_DREDA|nr:hypothetical protein Dda_2204 [Drechslerella dactyloides]
MSLRFRLGWANVFILALLHLDTAAAYGSLFLFKGRPGWLNKPNPAVAKSLTPQFPGLCQRISRAHVTAAQPDKEFIDAVVIWNEVEPDLSSNAKIVVFYESGVCNVGDGAPITAIAILDQSHLQDMHVIDFASLPISLGYGTKAYKATTFEELQPILGDFNIADLQGSVLLYDNARGEYDGPFKGAITNIDTGLFNLLLSYNSADRTRFATDRAEAVLRRGRPLTSPERVNQHAIEQKILRTLAAAGMSSNLVDENTRVYFHNFFVKPKRSRDPVVGSRPRRKSIRPIVISDSPLADGQGLAANEVKVEEGYAEAKAETKEEKQEYLQAEVEGPEYNNGYQLYPEFGAKLEGNAEGEIVRDTKVEPNIPAEEPLVWPTSNFNMGFPPGNMNTAPYPNFLMPNNIPSYQVPYTTSYPGYIYNPYPAQILQQLGYLRGYDPQSIDPALVQAMASGQFSANPNQWHPYTYPVPNAGNANVGLDFGGSGNFNPYAQYNQYLTNLGQNFQTGRLNPAPQDTWINPDEPLSRAAETKQEDLSDEQIIAQAEQPSKQRRPNRRR